MALRLYVVVSAAAAVHALYCDGNPCGWDQICAPFLSGGFTCSCPGGGPPGYNQRATCPPPPPPTPKPSTNDKQWCDDNPCGEGQHCAHYVGGGFVCTCEPPSTGNAAYNKPAECTVWGTESGLRLCFQEVTGNPTCGGSRDTCSEWSGKRQTPEMTRPFLDDTDSRGGCRYRWMVQEKDVLPGMAYRVCLAFHGPDGQCDDLESGPFTGRSCSAWIGKEGVRGGGLPYAHYYDNTDERQGGCELQWSIEQSRAHEPELRCRIAPHWYTSGEGGAQGLGQCGGEGHHHTTTGWSDAPSWSAPYDDFTDGRPGYCGLRMSLFCEEK